MSAATGRAERLEGLAFPQDCITPVAIACVSSPGTRTLTYPLGARGARPRQRWMIMRSIRRCGQAPKPRLVVEAHLRLAALALEAFVEQGAEAAVASRRGRAAGSRDAEIVAVYDSAPVESVDGSSYDIRGRNDQADHRRIALPVPMALARTRISLLG